MEENQSWLKFAKSGKVSDYLNFVNSCKGSEIIGGNSNTLCHRSACNKGNERGRKRPPSDTFQ